MATNFFFNNWSNSAEQTLIEDLMIESIKIYGMEVFYLPKSVQQYDKIYGEDLQASIFPKAYPIEMYIKNVEGFAGDGDFLSKFNIQIRDRITFTIARRIFADEIGADMGLARPREGDVIYFPLNHKLFQIKFVEHESIFYQMGALQVFDLVCELMEYTNEVFDTGVDEIDAFTQEESMSVESTYLGTEEGYSILLESGGQLMDETYYIEEYDTAAENDLIQRESAGILDFTEINPFSESKF